jgi:Flp pilus assembly protein TadD
MKLVQCLRAFLPLLLIAWALPAQTSHSGDGVSVDLLRHPIGEKARLLLRKVMDTMDAGEHEAAIKQLLDILSKHPESAAYVHSLLGVEYYKTGQFRAAVDSLEQAVALLPHNAFNHYNLAASLLRNRDLERGEREAQRALELDPDDPAIRALVDALKRAKDHTVQREPAVE